jgi:hypothetical protein
LIHINDVSTFTDVVVVVAIVSFTVVVLVSVDQNKVSIGVFASSTYYIILLKRMREGQEIELQEIEISFFHEIESIFKQIESLKRLKNLT